MKDLQWGICFSYRHSCQILVTWATLWLVPNISITICLTCGFEKNASWTDVAFDTDIWSPHRMNCNDGDPGDQQNLWHCPKPYREDVLQTEKKHTSTFTFHLAHLGYFVKLELPSHIPHPILFSSFASSLPLHFIPIIHIFHFPFPFPVMFSFFQPNILWSRLPWCVCVTHLNRASSGP